jgi:uncharacterized membrane protein
MVRAVRNNHGERQGIIMPFAALILAATMAFVAFSLDWGYIVLTETELQTAADAGALAGARALPMGPNSASAAAQIWAGKNSAAKSSVTLVNAEDIEIGAWNEATKTFAILPSTSMTAPNAVKVTCRRVGSRGTGLKLFFAASFGTKAADVRATAIARSKDEALGLKTILVQ